jgi:thiamine-monophosphate kinase
VTIDTLVEGIHFNERLSPADVGYKAIAVSVSDLAAMGAKPTWMVLAVSLPAADMAWLDAFSAGIRDALHRFDVTLIGGDTTRSPGPLVLTVTMEGIAERPVLRSGALPGHQVWLTGTPGLAGAGYLLEDPPATALRALRRPTPPLDFALELAGRGLVSAMMDLSDGLATDLPRLCRASGVGAEVEPARLPVHPALAAVARPLPLQVSAGDDYQLLFTAAAAHRDEIMRMADKHDVLATPVGRVTEELDVLLHGTNWPEPAFRHFPARQ